VAIYISLSIFKAFFVGLAKIAIFGVVESKMMFKAIGYIFVIIKDRPLGKPV
jgi:hypothetical protein